VTNPLLFFAVAVGVGSWRAVYNHERLRCEISRGRDQIIAGRGLKRGVLSMTAPSNPQHSRILRGTTSGCVIATIVAVVLILQFKSSSGTFTGIDDQCLTSMC
jgi:hypothetical protein